MPDDAYEIRCLLSLLGVPGVGQATILRLIDAAGSAATALRLTTTRLTELGLRHDVIMALAALRGRPDARSAEICAWLARHDVTTLTIGSDRYPARLRQIACPPPLLFVQGAVGALATPQVAIVGSRRASIGGREITYEIAGSLVKYGLTVTSGMAIGIDAAAHQGAVAASGCSIAVLGCGPDRIYPARHRQLAGALLGQGGAVVSEFLPGTRPEPANFPRRNRIISGLSLGVLVVEAALPSGSLLTARCALEQDREVMAVPGPVRSPYSRGTHELLRNGAALVENAEDVLRALGDRFRPVVSDNAVRDEARDEAKGPASLAAGLDEAERLVLEMTAYVETSTEVIVARTGLTAAQCTTALVRLELRGLVSGSGHGYTRLR